MHLFPNEVFLLRRPYVPISERTGPIHEHLVR